METNLAKLWLILAEVCSVAMVAIMVLGYIPTHGCDRTTSLFTMLFVGVSITLQALQQSEPWEKPVHR